MNRKALAQFRAARWKIVGLIVFGLFTAQLEAMALVLIVPLGQTIVQQSDHFNGKLGPLHIDIGINQMFLLAVTLMVASLAANVLSSIAQAWVSTRWEEQRRLSVIADFMNADYPTQRAERAGSLTVLTGYAAIAARVLSSVISEFQAVLSIATFVGIAFLLDVKAAVTILVVGAFISTLLRPLSTRVKPHVRQLASLQQEFSHEITDVSSWSRELRVFNAWPAVFEDLRSRILKMRRLRLKVAFLGAAVGPAYQYTALILVLVGLFLAKTFALVDVSVLGATALLLMRGTSYGQQLQSAHHSMAESMPVLAQLDKQQAIYRAHALPKGGIPVPPVQTLSCDNVSFSYDDEVLALEHVRFEFTKGQIVGIVGPSGGGKSTLSQIILRLRKPTAGAIRINGVDAAEYSLSSWYDRVSLVPQDPSLLHGTVFDNIAMFNPDISMQAVVDAATAAGIHRVIEDLPLGYDTLVGAAVRDLSGGQIQRIGIARALARGADILVLDEPSSALDVHSEMLVQETLQALGADKLVIIIAHRLSTLSICDHLMVMNRGAIEASGPLAEVTRTSAFFRKALDAGTLDIATIS